MPRTKLTPEERRAKRKIWKQKWRLANPEKWRAMRLRMKKRRYGNPKYMKKMKEKQFRRKHGITVEQREALFDFQGRVCSTCGTEDPGIAHAAWHLDHCHDTGVIRGVLCQHCNRALGSAKDNLATLERMVAYLKNPPGPKFFGTPIIDKSFVTGQDRWVPLNKR